MSEIYHIFSNLRVSSRVPANQVVSTTNTVVGGDVTVSNNATILGDLHAQGNVESGGSLVVATNASVNHLVTDLSHLSGSTCVASTHVKEKQNPPSFSTPRRDSQDLSEAMIYELPKTITALRSTVGVYNDAYIISEFSVTMADPVTGNSLAGVTTAVHVGLIYFPDTVNGTATHVLQDPLPPNTPFVIRYETDVVGGQLEGHVVSSAHHSL
jgi:hypothetical protein